MALQSGRVGVAPDQVDVYGRILGTVPSPTPSGDGLKAVKYEVASTQKIVFSAKEDIEDGILAVGDIRITGSDNNTWCSAMITCLKGQQSYFRAIQKSTNISTGTVLYSVTMTCTSDMEVYVIDYNNAINVSIVDK